MRNVAALTKRELLAYFLSPMAYVVLFVFLLLSGYVFFQSVTLTRVARVTDLMAMLYILLLLISPMLTMRLFADEFRSGTIETLMTAPVTTPEVVVSKYLASLFFLLVALVPTMLHAAVLFAVAEPDAGRVVTAYFGIFLLGSFFLGVGMVASACVRTQVSAAVVAIVALLALTVLPHLLPHGATGPLSEAVRYISYKKHFDEFVVQGVIDTRNVVYFVLCNAFSVFLTTVVVAVRRWR